MKKLKIKALFEREDFIESNFFNSLLCPLTRNIRRALTVNNLEHQAVFCGINEGEVKALNPTGHSWSKINFKSFHYSHYLAYKIYYLLYFHAIFGKLNREITVSLS